MTEKYFKSRIVHKHDIAENWLKATTFIPLKGELVVYDIDETHSYERFKIGDGKTLVNDLPFADDALKDFINNTYATKTAVNSAINNVHTHTNKSVLDGITSTQVSNWNAAEQNAKNYASNLNSSMDSRVQALESIDFEGAANSLLAEAKAYTDAKSFKVKKVNSLPATGDKSTIYVQNSEEFIWVEKSGTLVPNDGSLVKTVYFNIAKTEAEWAEVASQLNFIEGFAYYPVYPILVTATGDVLAVVHNTNYNAYYIGIQNMVSGDQISIFEPNDSDGVAIWQMDSYTFNAASQSVVQGVPVGTQNELLKDFISVTPLIKEKTIIPTLPNFIDTICFDTSKSIEETNAILEQLTYPVNMEMYYEKGYTVALWGEVASDISSSKNLGVILIRRAVYPASPDITRYFIEYVSTTGGFAQIYDINNGWQVDKIEVHAALSGSFNVLDGAASLGNLADIGTQNELLQELMWNEKIQGEWEKIGPSLEGYATEGYVDNAISNIPGVDLSDYATKDEIPSLKLATISLPASSWVGNVSPYSQVVSITGATQNSKIDLQPTIAQLSEMILNGLSMQAVNENGVVTVYVVGGKPTADYSMQALITEIEVG